jgi:hypothetical protein
MAPIYLKEARFMTIPLWILLGFAGWTLVLSRFSSS